jgi:hypothetical protein
MDPMMQSQLKEWFIFLATFALFGWVAYLGASIARRKQKNDMQKALLEKFSSAHDFAEFMQSPAGQKYVLSFADAVTSPRTSILNSIRAGFVLMFLGAGFLVASDGIPGAFFTIGWVTLALGIGFLISAGVAYFLTKRAGWKEE